MTVRPTTPHEPTPVVCAYCPDLQRRTAEAEKANGGRPVSHGICAECKAKMEAEL